ncbi:hypothetical protein B0T10DRAFT_582947 [Thelonectria olida]|uniref:Alpha/beta hydrolase fold-3 domain-containing protein n=1 Tax=Thelonectria olida TaxID=1576542 RepID=A0A9P9AKM3_9HYPO|nr:hypothetical protein B0T10DRAFT_582947 [Thelonectria olida]
MQITTLLTTPLNFIYILLCTPWLLSHFLLDVLLYILPWTRPAREWSLNQAARMRVVRLVLLYWSMAKAGNTLTLRPGRERNRLEIIHPQPSEVYTGVLVDTYIQPKSLAMTWTPSRPPPAKSIKSNLTVALHFHGGGFVIGNGRDEDTGYLARTLIRHMGSTHVCTPQYRLSSGKNGRFPAPLQDALTAYLCLVRDKRIPAAQIILSGDSAGANMALGLLRYIRDHGEEHNIPLPAAVALWSPWVDVSGALHQDIKMSPNYKTDYLSKEFGRWGALTISGFGAIDPSSPYLSPLHHPFKLSRDIPMFVHAGEREVLCDDIKAFTERYQEIGWRAHLVVSKASPHDILLLGPKIGFANEAEDAARKAGACLTSSTDIKIDCELCASKITCCLIMTSIATWDIDDLYFDIIIIGAGISGINAAYRIQTEGPSDIRYVILEGRESLGGTWDLFRYPGIRSDSDIFTFGFPWSPWTHKETLAAGDRIKDYITKSAESAGIDQHICYQHGVESANWNSAKKSWELQVRVPGAKEPVAFRSQFILLGTGYYNYETPLQTIIPGIENFQGKIIHPQFWPKDYDYTNQNVVVVGSGATAVTILPSMADKAKRVTMLQRSPGYVFSLPSNSYLTTLLFAVLPASLAHFINRLLWLFRSYLTTLLCKSCPGVAKMIIKRATIQQLPPDISWDPHFKPRYNPWEQRFCACMNGDFFAALRSGKADVVTDKIKMVTETTIELESGAKLNPDVIITATGLKLRFGGGIKFMLDGQLFNVADKFAWRALMLQDVPNLFFMTGYENASWTLGADVSARLFVRILNKMREKKASSAVPRLAQSNMPEKPMMTLNSTYLKNAGDVLPKGGTGQWSPKSNYFVDIAGARFGDISTDLELV